MTGLAVECALKSCLASEVKECDFPDKQFVNSMYVHDLESLFKLNGALWARLQSDIKADAELNGIGGRSKIGITVSATRL
jgi:hypothetical protein